MSRNFYHKLTCTPLAVSGLALCGRYIKRSFQDVGYGQFSWGSSTFPAAPAENDQHKVTLNVPDGGNVTLSVGTVGLGNFESISFNPADTSLVWPVTWKGFQIALNACPATTLANEPSINLDQSNVANEAYVFNHDWTSNISVNGTGLDNDAGPGNEWQSFHLQVVGVNGVIADFGTTTGVNPDQVSNNFSFSAAGATLAWHNQKFVVTAIDADGNQLQTSRAIRFAINDGLMDLATHPSHFSPNPEASPSSRATFISPAGQVWEPDAANGGTTWATVITGLDGGMVLRAVPKVVQHTVTALEAASGQPTFWFQSLQKAASSQVRVDAYINNVFDDFLTYDGPWLNADLAHVADTTLHDYTFLNTVAAGDVIRFEITGSNGGSTADADLPFLTHTNLVFAP